MDYYSSEQKQLKHNIIQMLMFKYLPYWPIFFALLVLSFVGGFFYLKLTPPKYRSSASVLVKDDKKGVDNSQMLESLNIYTAKKIVENEIEVIRSKSLLFQTAKELNLCAPIYVEKFFGPVDAFSTSPVIVEVKDINEIKESENNKFLFSGDSIYFNKTTYPLNTWINTKNGTIKFSRNPNIKQFDHTEIYSFCLIHPRKVIEDLEKSIEVNAVSKLSTVVTLNILDEDPNRGEKILYTLLKGYMKVSIDEKNRLASNTLEFVERRISSVEKQLDSLEAKIQVYKSSKGVVNLSEEGKLYLQNMGDNDRRLSEINVQLAVLEKVEDYVIKKDNKGGLVPSTLGFNDPNLSDLISKLYKSEIEYERLSKTTPENNLIMISLRKEIDKIRPGILENIRNQRQSLQAGLATINKSSRQYASVLQTIPRKERELLEINRQQLIKNNAYTFLLQKREETALAYASNVGDSRMIDAPVSSYKPVSPKKSIVFLLVFCFPFIGGVFIVSIKELFSSTILYRDQISSFTGTPVVAEIENISKRKMGVMDFQNDQQKYEQFKHLRTSLGLYGSNQKKVIMVTSSLPGEGKSFISVNLARSLVSPNRKILLIDLDLKNPYLTKSFNSENNPGISNVLNDPSSISTITSAEIESGLYFIGAGTDRNNGAAALLNFDLNIVFSEFFRNFDMVIIDTSPVHPVADAFVISPFTDICLFVIRHGWTPKMLLNHLEENSKMILSKKVSIVFNGIKLRGFLGRKNAYRNGYGYGYGYGYSYKKPKGFNYNKKNLIVEQPVNIS